MDEILKEFTDESKNLIDEMNAILEMVEEDPKRYMQLEAFGQIVDRMMGGAKSMALAYPKDHLIHTVASYCEICKIVGYKASQVPNPDFINIVTALLLDATETLETFNEQMAAGIETDIRSALTTTFLDRLRWVATKFDENLRASVAISTEENGPSKRTTQQDIDQILKQLGLT